MATSAILRYALERGHSMITSSVITEAVENILPAGAMQAMRAIGENMKNEGVDPEGPEVLGKLKDQMMEAHAGKSAEEVTLKCTSCGTILKGDVVRCDVCDATSERFLPIDKEEFKPDQKEEEQKTEVTTFDDVVVTWTQDAMDYLDEIPEHHVRRRARARIEKSARVQKIATISRAFASKIVNEKAVKEDVNGNGNGKNGNANGDGATKTIQEVMEYGAASDPKDFDWSKEALERLERVPKGFMRDNTQNRVMGYAKMNGIKEISLEVCEKGIAESVKLMEDAIKNGATLEDFLPKKEVEA